jgi:WD40 repeat protein
VHNFEGHRISVSSVDVDQSDPRLFYSTSFDKTVKCWDLRDKGCIATMQADSPLWDCKSVGKNVLVGGESGKLNMYTLG